MIANFYTLKNKGLISMMPYLYLFGKPLPMYGLSVLVGVIISGILVYLTIKKRRDYSKIYIINIPLVSTVGAFLGAHLVYAITRIDVLKTALEHSDEYFGSFGGFIKVFSNMFGGMVFYGGLLGAIFASYLYCKAAHADFSLYADILAPAIPLFHAFGRIGCTFAGCCYGLEASWGIPVLHVYEDHTTQIINHIPIPLIEAGCNIILSVILLILSKKKLKKGSLLAIYFIMYSIIRFIDEFFRGDLIRGHFLGLSTSQWISIAVLFTGIYMLLRRYVLKTKDRYGYKVPVGEVPEGYAYNKYAGAISPYEQEKFSKKHPEVQFEISQKSNSENSENEEQN